MNVRDVMSTDLVTVDKDRNLKDVLSLMAEHRITKIPVTEDGELSGFINVYVNDRDVRYRDGLATAVGPDDTIILLPAMAGGARQA